MSNLNLAIITPEGKLFEGEAEYVNLPGSEGRFEVLEKHMNFIASLIPGVVEISVSGVKKHFIVFDGIAEVNASSCSVLVEKGLDVKDINKEKASEALSSAQHDLAKAETESLKSQLTKEVMYLEAILGFSH